MRFSELEGARVGVWGAGREIASFARQLKGRLPTARIDVIAFDAPPEPGAIDAVDAPGATVAVGARVMDALAPVDVVVRSPGVSVYREELRSLRAGGTPVTTATALWLDERSGRSVLGVTGTKGKSTTAALAAHLARAAGVDALLAGNIGVPALDLLDEDPEQPAIVELSSYQIADLVYGPEVALITNLYREHVDWHRSDAAYRSDKLRILGLPGVERAVLNARDPSLPRTVAPRTTLFGDDSGWNVRDGAICLRGESRARAEQLPLRGEHNLLNVAAALAGIEALGIEPTALPESVAGFEGLAHRLEEVGTYDGATWIDDSISTTPESTLAALASFPGHPLLLIAGGQDREQDYGSLAEAIADSDATLIGIPTTGPSLVEAARAAGTPAGRALEAADLEAAVELAREQAQAGAVVLLSPAAPSYDNFKNFEERGKRFREAASRPARAG